MGSECADLIPAAVLLLVALSSTARCEHYPLTSRAPSVYSNGAWRVLFPRKAFVLPAAPLTLRQPGRLGSCQQLSSSGGGGRGEQLLRPVLGGTRLALHAGARAGAKAARITTRAASGSETWSRNASAAAAAAASTSQPVKQPAKKSAAKKTTLTTKSATTKTKAADKKTASKNTGKISAASEIGEETSDASEANASSEEELSVEAGDEYEAPVKRKRRMSKKNSWTDDALLEEFALKAIMLLREAGGELESTKFQRRWKCTFPSDEISRYMRGRRLSVRQLLQQCGNMFTINDIPGSRSKKLFAISDERQALSVTASTEALMSEIPFELGTATLLRQGSASAGGPLLWASDLGNLMLDWNISNSPSNYGDTSETRGERITRSRGRTGSTAGDDVVRVVKVGGETDKDTMQKASTKSKSKTVQKKTKSPAKNTASSSVDTPSAINLGVEDDPGSLVGGVSSSSTPSSALAGGADGALSYGYYASSRSQDEEESDSAFNEWDLEMDGKILKKEREGACNEFCCELAVGDEECAQNVKNGLDLIQSFKSMGITFGNVLSYNALLDMCSLAANQQTSTYANYALSILEMMRDNGVAPNAESYSAVIRSCSQSREGLFKAIGVLLDMRTAGSELPIQDYYLLFDACAKEAQRGNGIAVEQGLAVLETMCAAHLLPDANRCLAMISVIPREGAWCNFCRDKVVEIMKESGLDNQSVAEAMKLARELNA